MDLSLHKSQNNGQSFSPDLWNFMKNETVRFGGNTALGFLHETKVKDLGNNMLHVKIRIFYL